MRSGASNRSEPILMTRPLGSYEGGGQHAANDISAEKRGKAGGRTV